MNRILSVAVIFCLSTSIAFAVEVCPKEPANGHYYTVDEFNDAQAALNECVCCCINNIVGEWEQQAHLPVEDGCDCPNIDPDWICFQIWSIETRSFEPVQYDLLPPPPPAGGWANSMVYTSAIFIECNCTDQDGNTILTPNLGCVTMRGGWVPVLYTPCTPCPWPNGGTT